jgi:hypothetical protein
MNHFKNFENQNVNNSNVILRSKHNKEMYKAVRINLDKNNIKSFTREEIVNEKKGKILITFFTKF